MRHCSLLRLLLLFFSLCRQAQPWLPQALSHSKDISVFRRCSESRSWEISRATTWGSLSQKILTSPNFHMLKEYTKTNTASLIFVSRFMTEIGPSVNVLSGIIGMSYRKYIFLR